MMMLMMMMSSENIGCKYWNGGNYGNCDIEIDHGQERIADVQNSVFKQDQPSFYGYCYYCDYSRHSQNYCPLRYCQFCKSYGHSSKVCINNSAQGSIDWRTKIQREPNCVKEHRHESKFLKSPLLQQLPQSSQSSQYIGDKAKSNQISSSNRDIRPGSNFKHWKRSHSSTKSYQFGFGGERQHFEKIKIPFGSTWKQNTSTLVNHSNDQELDWRRSMTKSFHCGVLVELD